MATEDVKTSPESRRELWVMFAIAAIASALGIALGLLIDWFPVAASEEAGPIDTLYDVLIIASVPMFVLVTAVVLYCAWRFKMKPGEEEKDGPPIHGSTKLEVIWTIIPAVLMFGLCAYAYIVLDDIESAKAGEDPLKVRVVGEQFTWTFFYEVEGGEEVASNRLYVPVGRQVDFQVQSKDVLHDFWVPAWRMKIDAVPGINTYVKMTPNREGTYPVVCAELCGLGHSVMRQDAYAVPPEEFEQWLAEKQQGEGETTEGGQGEDGTPEDASGKALFTGVEPSCGSCHSLADAGTQATTGPDLDESLAGRDEAYIRESIVDPEAQITEGFEDLSGVMPPNYGDTLDPEEIDALVKYLAEVTK